MMIARKDKKVNGLRQFFLFLLLSLSVGAGAVELPVLNRAPGSDWVNVKTLGARGDGKTDDSAAINRALAAMNDGSIVYFPSGTYVIKQELRILKTRFNREKRYLGNALYGHGRDTVLRWEGEENGTMLRDMGMLHCRISGLVFDGAGRAATGINHDNDNKFETHLYNEFLEFRNFRQYAMYFENNSKDGLSTAEILMRYCIFRNTGTAASFTSFNDYNYTFDGCSFLDNKRYAIECFHGNFYVRNCRFERNGIDIWCNPEHASSVRRSVSIGSDKFIEFSNSVSPLTIENCYVADWTGECAIQTAGAPVTIFDNLFTHPRTDAIPLKMERGQKGILANNQLRNITRLTAEPVSAGTLSLPENRLRPGRDTRFMPKQVAQPGRLFDAKRDFGAIGNGKADDTTAIQKTIDAARASGNNAIAYLPRGDYRITRTLEISGGSYQVGGSGIYSRILFDGSPDMDAVAVRPQGELTLDALSVHRFGMRLGMNIPADFTGKGADIHQYPSPNGSKVTYHTVYTTGKYQPLTYVLGLRLDRLTAKDTVVILNGEGNVHVWESGAATIFMPVSYEGSVWLRGKARGGNCVILTRLATHSTHSLVVEDNLSLIATDFYIEQAQADTLLFKGSSDLPQGRVTLSLPKLDVTGPGGNANPIFTPMFRSENYRGEINMVATQLAPGRWKTQFSVEGDATRLNMIASFFYISDFAVKPKNLRFGLIECGLTSKFNRAATSFTNADRALAPAATALLDLRAAGELDWKLNYPALSSARR